MEACAQNIDSGPVARLQSLVASHEIDLARIESRSTGTVRDGAGHRGAIQIDLRFLEPVERGEREPAIEDRPGVARIQCERPLACGERLVVPRKRQAYLGEIEMRFGAIGMGRCEH